MDKSYPLILKLNKFKMTKVVITDYYLENHSGITNDLILELVKNKLSTEQLAQKINLTIPETESILFTRINEFTMGRLILPSSKGISIF